MAFLENHTSKDDPFTRVLFYSVLLHYALFFIFFGNPFLLNLDDTSEGYGMQQGLNIELLHLPGTEGEALLPKQQALGLFPPEVKKASGKDHSGQGLNAEAFHDKPSQITQAPARSDMAAFKPPSPVNAIGQGKVFRLGGAIQHEGLSLPIEEPPPLITSKKPPPNMTGLEDCMIKVVGMVCPNGDAKCIAEYKTFCATFPK
ncbi:hypothetical protein MNBD_NITROSPIRAE01-618 [hydrothermal vent metagenome]|uniref:Uncharacterized protein n=1 Tax=hydrothermal vent metagenome TaxID=652676 RepID=A0A3B1CQK4_9ZZZZ